MRDTPWILTASGARFHLAEPMPQEFRVEDMASALSRICRFNGHIDDERWPDHAYSVAQHSVYVMEAVEHPASKLWALLHDGPEAYYGDMISPLKSLHPDYSAREDHAAAMMRRALGIPYDDSVAADVKRADRLLLILESAALTKTPSELWDVPMSANLTIWDLDPDFRLWGVAEARERFLAAYLTACSYRN